MKSELVKSAHLARKAVVYIRQSTPHQVVSNQESLQLQYALRKRHLTPTFRSGLMTATLGLLLVSGGDERDVVPGP